MMRDIKVNSYKLHMQNGKVIVEDHSFRYWSVSEIMLRNRK